VELWKTKKHFFAVMVVEHWNKLSREFMEFPSVEILRTQQDMVLDNLL